MTKIKIVDVRLKPWWKFWRIANVEVTVEDEQGRRRAVRVYKTLSNIPSFIDFKVFEEFVGYKYCTNDQFWDINRRKAKPESKEPKVSDKESLRKYAAEIIGKSFDCVDLMSKEEE